MSAQDSFAAAMVNDQIGTVAHETGRSSLAAFCIFYLRHHFSLTSCRMHTEVGVLLQKAATVRNARIAIAAPRGSRHRCGESLAMHRARRLWSG